MVFLSACSSAKDNSFESDEFVMGTIVSQKVYGEKAQEAIGEATEKIKDIEKLMTFNSPEGDIYKINENAGKNPVEISPETAKVLDTTLKISELSKGAFDPTVGPVVRSWNIGSDQERIPTEEELQKLVALISYKDIYFEDQSVGLKKSGQMIDLGGIAKGYAGDIAVEIYRQQGCVSGTINIGGNVVVLGNKPDGSLWNIGIQNPRSENGQIIGFIKIADKAVVTSGDYQRFFEKDGKRYHHIFDPHTGYPAQSGLMSVTVVADSSMEADALSTAMFVLGLEKGLELLKEYGQAEAIFITTDKEVYVTEGLKNKFQLRDETNEYTYVQKG